MIPYPDIDPVILSIPPLQITWYGVSYVAGILICWWRAIHLVQHNKLNLQRRQIDDYITWIIIGIIIGGRLGYVFFYDLIKFINDPLEIVKTYHGGMSFHGGLAGYILASFLFCYKNNIKPAILLDISALCAPIALFLGRLANFINGELYGKISTVPWAMIFPYGGPLPRHPSQLYEALLEGVLMFIILNYYGLNRKMLHRPWAMSGMFLVLYGLFRFLVEFARQPDWQVGYLAGIITMGQALSAPMILLGAYLLFKSNNSKQNN